MMVLMLMLKVDIFLKLSLLVEKVLLSNLNGIK